MPTNSLILDARTFLGRAWLLAKPYWRSDERRRAWLLLVTIISLSLCIVYLLVLLNDWNRQFFNAIQDKNKDVEVGIPTLQESITMPAHDALDASHLRDRKVRRERHRNGLKPVRRGCSGLTGGPARAKALRQEKRQAVARQATQERWSRRGRRS